MRNLELGVLLGAAMSADEVGRAARSAEDLGFESLWSSEAWGNDAFTPLAFAAAVTSRIGLGTAIAQIPARTPAATAMAALTLQQLSGGRLLLGLGVSGPQVVEGWHGVPFVRPLTATRDYIAILRKALAADQPVEHEGSVYSVPARSPVATGMGRSLRASLPGAPDTPLLLAAVGPRNVKLATEIADGILPFLWSPSHWRRAWGDVLESSKPGFRVMPIVWLAMGEDLDRCRALVRRKIARYVGEMGAGDQNFYANLVIAYGYPDTVARIRERCLDGDRAGAAAAVPDELVDDLALVGDVGRVRGRLELWAESPVSSLIVDPLDDSSLALLARARS